MKSLFLTYILLVVSVSTFAQKNVKTLKNHEPIAVSDIKTTHIIFKEKIKYMDLGSRYFVLDSIENILRLKHIGGEFTEEEEHKETNLTVMTKSGDYFSIPLYYKRNIKTTSYEFGKAKNSIDNKPNDASGLDQSLLYEICAESTKTKSNQNIRGKRSNLILSKVSGIFYREDYMVMRVEVKNFATIDLDIDHILFRFIKKNKLAKKDFVYQERVLRPIKVCNAATRVDRSGGIEVYTFIFKKFTPNVDEKLHIDIIEKDGGRSSTIIVRKKELLSPKVI